MRADDLDHEELLELDPEGGVIRFAAQRALLLDAVAMGLLRKYLVENFGLTAARAVLTQFGFAHGWRMADAMQNGALGWSTTSRRARRARSSPSIAAPSPRRCSRASCSATRGARSRARPSIGRACFAPPVATIGAADPDEAARPDARSAQTSSSA